MFLVRLDKINFDASARMFAPRYAINEEAATGMAAGPLGCYLFGRRLTTKTQLVINEGDHMPIPSPSLIRANIHIEITKFKSRTSVGTPMFATR